MLLERNAVLIGVIAVVATAVATVFAVVLSADLFRSGDRITVELGNSEGLTAGDEVVVAGMRAGSVDSVRIDGDRVAVEIRLEVPVPADSSAQVTLRNLLGRRSLEVVPGRDWTRLLADEDDPRIPLERTVSLVDLPDVGDETVALLRDADTDALRTLIAALADVTEGQRDELADLLEGLSQVSVILIDNRDELEALIDRAHGLVSAAAEKDQEIVAIVDTFGSTLDVLADRRSDLQRLLRETVRATTIVADLVGEERVRIDSVLGELHDVLAIVDRHQVDIAQTLAYGGVAFYGFSEVGRQGEEDNPYWGDIATSGAGLVGIDAIGGCGGILDQVLDLVLGPADCLEEPTAEGGPATKEARPAPGLADLLGAVVGGTSALPRDVLDAIVNDPGRLVPVPVPPPVTDDLALHPEGME